MSATTFFWPLITIPKRKMISPKTEIDATGWRLPAKNGGKDATEWRLP